MHKKEALEQAQYIMEAGKLIHDRVSRIVTGHAESNMKRKELYELSVPQFHAVKATRARGEVSITELSEILAVSPPSVSAMVDRLVERGVMTRERSHEDRRKVVVQISSEAIEDVEKLEKKILKSFLDLIEKIGPETARKWCEVLEQVKTVLEKGDTK